MTDLRLRNRGSRRWSKHVSSSCRVQTTCIAWKFWVSAPGPMVMFGGVAVDWSSSLDWRACSSCIESLWRAAAFLLCGIEPIYYLGVPARLHSYCALFLFLFFFALRLHIAWSFSLLALLCGWYTSYSIVYSIAFTPFQSNHLFILMSFDLKRKKSRSELHVRVISVSEPLVRPWRSFNREQDQALVGVYKLCVCI